MIKINDSNYVKNDNLLSNNNPISIIIVDTNYIDNDYNSLYDTEVTNGDYYSINNLYENYFFKYYKCLSFPFHYYIRRNGEIFKGREDNNPSPYIDNYINEEGNLVKNGLFTSIYKKNNTIEIEDDLEYKNNNSSNSINKIFICMEGNFDKDLPTNSQYYSLINLCRYIKDNNNKVSNIFNLNEVYKDFNTPGIFFKINEIRSKFQNTITKEYYKLPNGNISYTLGKRELYYDKNDLLYGNDIKLLQSYLNKIGYLDSKYINSIYDYHTYETICMIQDELGYTEDNKNGSMDNNIYKFISDKINNINNVNYENNNYHRILIYNPNYLMYGNDIAEINEKLYLFNFNKNNKNIINENLINDKKYYFSEDSELAVKEFQKLLGYKIDGIVGPILFNTIINYKIVNWELSNFSTINKDSDSSIYGDIIKVIQRELYRISRTKGISMANIEINGIYDDNTANNISILQMILGLEQTGEVNEELFNLLKTF